MFGVIAQILMERCQMICDGLTEGKRGRGRGRLLDYEPEQEMGRNMHQEKYSLLLCIVNKMCVFVSASM
jgi:hypothetical protein